MEVQNREIEHIINLITPYYIMQSITNLVSWDQETYMPVNGMILKEEQTEFLKLLSHKYLKKSSFRSALSKLIDLNPSLHTFHIENLNWEEKALLREIKEEYLRVTSLSASIVKATARATTRALESWKQAKQKNDYSFFYPDQKKVIHEYMRQAKAYQKKEGDHLYNSLLHLYEPKMTVEILDPITNELKQGLLPLVQEIQANQQEIDPTLCSDSPLSINKQMDLCHEAVSLMGLDKENYNLSTSEHPFCTALSSDDIRITTRFDEANCIKGLLAVMHEAGHALYESRLPKEWKDTPLASAASHGIHESQARFWENFIGTSLEFWRVFYPRLQSAIPHKFSEVSLEKFYASLNYSSPSYIRIYADEITYNLHIMIRYEIEKEIFEKSLSTQKIKERFNELTKKYLGLEVKNDSEGVLQDIHWAMGGYGYFPSYMLGNLYAAMLFHAFENDHPRWGEELLETGNAFFIRDWLDKKVLSKGKKLPPKQLIEEACQSEFSCLPFLKYIKKKYTATA